MAQLGSGSAAHAARATGEADTAPAAGAVPAAGAGAANGAAPPLSMAQERWWFLSQLRPDSPLANTARAVRLRGPLDVSRLRRSFGDAVRQHDILRASFPNAGGRPRQMVAHPGIDVIFDVLDIPGFLRARDHCRVWARQPFDVHDGPLVRGLLIHTAGDDHLFAVVAHQLVSDEASVTAIMREVAAHYSDAVGTPGPSPVRYAQVATEQRGRISSGELDRHVEYWRDRLAGAAPALELPGDRARPAMLSFAAGRHDVVLPGRLMSALSDHSSGAPTTALLAGLVALVFRYTGRDDIVLGLSRDGRPLRAAGAVGPFTDTTVLRTNCPPGESFAALVRRVDRELTGSADHAQVPFELLVDRLAPVRDLSRNPLVQLLFRIDPPDPQPATFAGLDVEPVDPELAVTRLDLELHVIDRGDDSWIARFVYSTDLFDSDNIARLADAYVALLESAAARPATAVSGLPLVSATDTQLIASWNSTGLDVGDQCVHELVESRALAAPDATAVVYEGRSLTYGELRARANRLAHYLRQRGVGPDTVVGMCVPRGIDSVVTILGILKAGGAYLPLDAGDPVDRLAFVVTDAGAALTVTAALPAEVVGQLPGAMRLDADETAAAIAGQPDTTPKVDLTPEHGAYVIFTSGSTGQPKGACVPHGGWANLVGWHLNRYPVGPGDRCGQFARVAFDASAWELGSALAAGATLVVAPEEARQSSEAALGWLRREAVTVAFLPVQFAERLLRNPAAAELSLRVLLTGSDRLMQYPPAALPFTVENHYGPTECSVIGTAGTVPVSGGDRPPPIGVPIANTEIHILDSALHPVPIGAPGELYIGGAGVGRGYVNRPGLTAERFLPDAFSGRSGARLYRTGDQARWTVDGTLEFLGRIDHQVKIRGYRIEVGEIESCLLEHPAVAEAVVIVLENAPGDKRLVGYVRGDGEVPTAAALRAFLIRRLPDYMIPSTWVSVADFPRNASGKVDRNALPPPRPNRPDLDSPYVAPRTPTEQTLARIFAEVLTLDNVGVYDNFFELGGNSLLAMNVIGLVERELAPKDIDLRAVFEYPTIAELASSISAQLDNGQETTQ